MNNPLFSTELTSNTYINDKEEPTIESVLGFNNEDVDSMKNNIFIF